MSVRNRVAVATVILASVFGLGVAGWAWSGSNRSELAGWMEAAATIAAVIAATVAAWYAASALDREQERDRVREQDGLAAQAQQVAVWIAEMPNGPHHVGYQVHNGSSLPIYHVLLAVEDVDGDDHWETEPVDVVPPGGFERDIGSETGAAWSVRNTMLREWKEAHEAALHNAQAKDQLPLDTPPIPGPSRAMLRFIDARGSHWERDFNGRLRIIRPGPSGSYADAFDLD